ncbi:MAG: DUF4326 domain-containing protein [Haloferacaceae archaeon]
MTGGSDDGGDGSSVDPLADPVGAVRARVPDDLTVPESDRGRRIVHEPTGTELVSVRRFEPTRRIDGDSPFAGPFDRPSVLGDGSDAAAVGLYEGWFRGRLLEDESFAAAVSDLSGERLGCHCLPRPCHGEVILAHIAAARG